MIRQREEDISFLGECFINDISIQKREYDIPNKANIIEKAVRILKSCIQYQYPLVYTAFDGDHFHFLQQMRQYVINSKYTPVNPESVLGYRNTVMRTQSKRGVLIEDLSILRKCQELWIFSDVSNDLDGISSLSEGVLTELVYFLCRHDYEPKVKLISLEKILRGVFEEPVEISITYELLKERLVTTNKEGVLDIANNGFCIEKDLKFTRCYIIDPLDFKYHDWIRRSHKTIDELSVIPGTIVETSDFSPSTLNLGMVLINWWNLTKHLCDSCTLMTTLDKDKSNSMISEIFSRLWKIDKNSKIDIFAWDSFNVLKSVQKDKWPITHYESLKIK